MVGVPFVSFVRYALKMENKMKMKMKTKVLALLSCLILTLAAVFAIGALAEDDTDAMIAIREGLSAYQIGETVKLS